MSGSFEYFEFSKFEFLARARSLASIGAISIMS